MALNLFKLSGVVDVQTGRAEANLRKVDASAKTAQRALSGTSDTARKAGGDFDRAASGASNLSGKLGAMRGVAGGLGNAFAGIGTELLTGAIGKLTSGFTAVTKAGLDFNKQMEAAQLVFGNMTGSMEGGIKHLEALKAFAKSSPFDLPDLIQASARMQAFGFSSAEVLPKLKNLQNAAALAAGTSGNFTEALSGITTALGQMKANGRVTAEEMNQLTERGIPAWDLLSKKIGLSVAETRKLSEAGQLRGAPAVEALLESFGEGKFAGLGEKLSQTVMGKESNLRDALNQQAGAAGKETFEAYRGGLESAMRAAQSPNVGALGGRMDKLTAGNIGMASEIMDAISLTGNQQGKTSSAQAFKELGVNAVTGFVEGMKQSSPGIASTVQGWIQTAKDVLGIKSPSTVFAAMGADAVAGFDLGMENSKKRSARSVIDVEKAKAALLEDLRKLRNDPAVRAMLDTIALAEGANYNTLFGGSTFSGYGAHPNQSITRKLGGKNISSTAAGRYQFLNKTWDWASGAIGLKDFSPESQDLAAIWLMKNRGMLGPLGQGNIAGALTAGNREWASLPGSPYGQPTQKAETLITAFEASLAALTQATTQLTTAFTQTVPAVQQIASVSGQIAQGGALGGMTVTAGQDRVPLAAIPEALKNATLEAPKLKAALDPLPPVIEATATTTRDWKTEIVDMGAKAKEAIDHFAQFKDAFAAGFDDLFDSLLEGGKGALDSLKRMFKDLLHGLLNGAISSMTGGRAGSPGQLLSGMLFGGMSGGGGAMGGGGLGGFLTGGFAGGNPAMAAMGGGGGGGSLFGGVLSKIPFLGKFFGGGARSIGGLPTITRPDVFNPALGGGGGGAAAGGFGAGMASLGASGLMMGGGLLGSMAGGKSGIGRLLGGLGGTLLGGAAAGSGMFGGAMAGMMPALFSNPITAIIGGALIGGAFLARWLSGGVLRSLKKLVRGEYGIEVKSDKVLENIKALGESKFGKAFKKRQLETIRLSEVRELLSEYAERTSQKGNSKLFSRGQIADPYAPENRFAVPRANGGPVVAGHPYIVGERRPEVFVPSTSGQILANVPQGGRGIVPTGGPDGKYLLEVLEELSFAVGRLKGVPAGQIVQMGLEERPGIAARDVRKAFDQRSEDANLIRERMEKR